MRRFGASEGGASKACSSTGPTSHTRIWACRTPLTPWNPWAVFFGKCFAAAVQAQTPSQCCFGQPRSCECGFTSSATGTRSTEFPYPSPICDHLSLSPAALSWNAKSTGKRSIYAENVVCPCFLPDVGEGGEALGLGAARVAAGLEQPRLLVELRGGNKALGPVGRHLDGVAATTQLVDRLGAEAGLDAHVLRRVVVRREEAGEVVRGQLRRFDRLLDRHAE